MCSSKCLVAFGVFLQMWNVMDMNDTKKPRITRPKSFLACAPVSSSDRSSRHSKRKRKRKCCFCTEMFADRSYLWSKDFLTRNNTFIFNSAKWIFLPGNWLIAFWTVQTLASSHKLLWNFSIYCVRNPSPSFPVASATCSGLQTPSDNVLCSLSSSCSRLHAHSSHPHPPQLFIFRVNGYSFFCNIFSCLYLPWHGGPELCVLFWFAIACSGFYLWAWVC